MQNIKPARAASLIAALLAGLFGAQTAYAQNIHARYTTWFLGLPVSSASVVSDLQADSYRIKGTGETTLLAGIFKPMKASLRAEGRLSQLKTVPSRYTTLIKGEDLYDIGITFKDGRITAEHSIPPRPPAPDFVAVTEAMKRGSLDPLSAFAILVPDGKPERACARTLPIYTGRERFDLVLSYKDSQPIDIEGFYSGKAVVCAVRYVPLGGHRAKKKEILYMKDNKDIEGWFIPVPGSRAMLLAKVRIGTKLGPVSVTLDKASLMTAKEAEAVFAR